MPLRITIELVPHGDESRKERLAVVECENDCTADRMGNGQVANYLVTGQAHLYEEGWGEFAPLRVEGVRRYRYMPGDPDPIRDYMGTAAACLSALANAKAEPHGELARGMRKHEP